MSSYTPEGVDMSRVEHPEYEAYLPTVANPLDVESPKTEDEAAEKVCTYLYQASGDPGTMHLQWHAAQIAIHPWSIQQDTFKRLVEELPEGFPWFEHELAYEVWFSDVAFSLDKKEDQS